MTFLLTAAVDVQHFSQDLDWLGARTGLRALSVANQQHCECLSA